MIGPSGLFSGGSDDDFTLQRFVDRAFICDFDQPASLFLRKLIALYGNFTRKLIELSVACFAAFTLFGVDFLVCQADLDPFQRQFFMVCVHFEGH